MTSIQAKARRLVQEGAVRITTRAEDVVVAMVVGDSRSYRVTVSTDGAFRGCACPAIGDCSHLIALESVLAAAAAGKSTPEEEPLMYPPDDPERPFDAEADEDAPETAEVGPEGQSQEDPVSGQAPAPRTTESANGAPEADTDAQASHTPADITEVDPETGEILSQPDQARAEASLAAVADAPVTFQTLKAIAMTQFIPAALRGKPMAILACVLYGRELGLGPMQALAHVDVIDGRPSPSAELLARLIRTAGHKIKVLEHTDEACRLRGTRVDTGETLEVAFSIEDAARAGLVSIDAEGNLRARSRTGAPLPWELYPSDLLWARAVVRLHRRLFSDVTSLHHPDTGPAGRPQVRTFTAPPPPEEGEE